MINPIQITTDDTHESRADGTVEVVNTKSKHPRFVALNYEQWCELEAARIRAKGIDSVVKSKVRDGVRLVSVWRDGRGCFRLKKNQSAEQADE